MFENSDDFLTVDETCELLKMGHNAVYRLLNSGRLKALRNGRVWRVPKQAIIEYTKKRYSVKSFRFLTKKNPLNSF